MVLAASIQYSVVLVVVCLPELSAVDISCVSTCAWGTQRLMSVLFPAPEGPRIRLVLPCKARASSSLSVGSGGPSLSLTGARGLNAVASTV